MSGIERRLARLEALQPQRLRWGVPILETTDPDSPEHQARLAERRDEALRMGWRPEADGILTLTVVLPPEFMAEVPEAGKEAPSPQSRRTEDEREDAAAEAGDGGQ